MIPFSLIHDITLVNPDTTLYPVLEFNFFEEWPFSARKTSISRKLLTHRALANINLIYEEKIKIVGQSHFF